VGDELLFHSPSLIKAGTDLQKAAVKLNTEWESLQTASQGLTFGDDIVSSLIGISYQVAGGMAQKTYGSAAEGFASYGEAIAIMAGVYTTTETANTDDMGAV
jgi:hypothetical protein